MKRQPVSPAWPRRCGSAAGPPRDSPRSPPGSVLIVVVLAVDRVRRRCRNEMRAQPTCERVFGHRAFRKGEHGSERIRIVGDQRETIIEQEQLRDDKSGALVAVDEGMVA